MTFEWGCSAGHKWIGPAFTFKVIHYPEYSTKGLCPYCLAIAIEKLVTSDIFEISNIKLDKN